MSKILNDIMESMQTIHVIACSKCSKKDKIEFCDEFEAAEVFKNDGWRIKRDHIFCSECNKKNKNGN